MALVLIALTLVPALLLPHRKPEVTDPDAAMDAAAVPVTMH